MWLRQKNTPEIFVMSRSEVVQYCREKQRKPSVIISISDPYNVYDNAPFCSPLNRVFDILPLSFCDAAEPGKDVYGRDVTESEMMTDEDARKVVRFVRENRDKRIIVHCDAGISRSAGVAAAISKYLTGNDGRFFRSGEYDPNMWCYTKTLMTFLEG